jgi:amidophosphoribosyltransferase
MSGLFGIINKSKDCIDKALLGADYHSHLGTQQAGLGTRLNGGTFKVVNRDISSGIQFKAAFTERDLKKLRGRKGIGAVSDHDTQPILKKFGEETVCITTSGYIPNIDALAHDLVQQGHSLDEHNEDGSLNMPEIVGELINQKTSIPDGIEHMFDKIEGSCSLLYLNSDGLYAARDRHGRTPLVLARDGDGWAVTSETSALHNLDYRIEHRLRPGEVMLVNEDGPKTLRKGDDSLLQICSFLWIYTGDPASSYEGVGVHHVKQRCGGFLARRTPDLNVDVVSGCPYSGIGHAQGYFNEKVRMIVENQRNLLEMIKRGEIPVDQAIAALDNLNLPILAEPLIKFSAGYARSYLPPTPELRNLIAGKKLIPVGYVLAEEWDEITREYAKGNRILVVDDSIVRNTQLMNSIKKLKDFGAAEVHVAIACPPLTSPCQYLRSTRTRAELAASRAMVKIVGGDVEDTSPFLDYRTEEYAGMVDIIRAELDVDSLVYQTRDDMVKAIGLPEESLCLDCWR